MKKQGFIFIYVLLLSFLILSVGTYIFNKGIVLPPFVKFVEQDQKKRILVLGVIQHCIAQLAISKEETADKKLRAPKDEKQSVIMHDVEHFFPELNRWHNYLIKEKVEGVDADVSICFTCEEGKINVNNFFDFKEKRLKKDPLIDELSKALERFQIKGFKDQLEQFFKKKGKPIDDLAELLQDDYFQKNFGKRIFYDPPKPNEVVEKKEIYLMDLFTVYNADLKLNPLFLSDSVTQVLEFRRAITQAVEERKKHVDSIKSILKDTVSWQGDWEKIMQPMYQKPIGRFEQLFKKNLKCTIFSALCRVKIGEQTETVFVICARKERAQDDKIMYDVAIMRLYFV